MPQEPKLSSSPGPLEISFSGNSFYATCEEEVPLSKLLLNPTLISVLGYPPNNIEALIDGSPVDLEYYAGKKKEKIQLIIGAHRKEVPTDK